MLSSFPPPVVPSLLSSLINPVFLLFRLCLCLCLYACRLSRRLRRRRFWCFIVLGRRRFSVRRSGAPAGQVNGVPTPTLDTFLDAVKDIGDKSPARVKTVRK